MLPLIADEEWKKLIAAIHGLSEWFPDGMVLIGGVAVYLHASARSRPDLAEFSHDGDFYLSLADYADLRDIEEVTPNRRLGKSQIIKDGFDFDIYVEHNNGLAIPYGEAAAHSTVVAGVRCACLEHLLALKADACLDRKGSAKGEKDERDIARIILLLDDPDPVLASRWLDGPRMDLVSAVLSKPQVFDGLAGGNAHAARQIKAAFQENLAKVKNAIEEENLASGHHP